MQHWTLLVVLTFTGIVSSINAQIDTEITPDEPTSIQRALDRQPGRMHFVPPSDHVITRTTCITSSASYLWGPGRIIQPSPAANIIELENVNGTTFRDLTLTRADPEALTWPITRPGSNIDGHSIVANNIISDFVYGTAHWMWKIGANAPIQLNVSPAGEKSPPLTNVLISSNVVYDTGRDGIVVDGKVKVEPPCYAHAVRIASGELGPRGLRFSDNIFHPGTAAVSNSELPAPPSPP